MGELTMQALSFGFAEYQKNGITYRWPDGPVGVSSALESLPENVRLGLKWKEATKTIFSYRSIADATTFGIYHKPVTGSDPTRILDPNSVEARDKPLEPVGGEAVNIKIDVTVKWNGPLVQAIFHTPADGQRARLGAEASVEVRKPTSEVEAVEATPEFAAIGLLSFPVIEIPISVAIDEPFPNDNLKCTFDLVLSGMYGFGRSASGHYIKGGRANIHRD